MSSHQINIHNKETVALYSGLSNERKKLLADEWRQVLNDTGFFKASVNTNNVGIQVILHDGEIDSTTVTNNCNMSEVKLRLEELHRLIDENPENISSDCLVDLVQKTIKHEDKEEDQGPIQKDYIILDGQQEDQKESENLSSSPPNLLLKKPQETSELSFDPAPSPSTPGMSKIDKAIVERGRSQGIDVSGILQLRANPQYSQKLQSALAIENISLILKMYHLFKNEIQAIKGKDIVLLVGPTRSGKSSTMLYLAGVKFELKNPEDTEFDSVVAHDNDILVPLDASLKTSSIIGHDTYKSHTFFPLIYDKPMSNNPMLKLVDFPGFLDSSGWQIRIAIDFVLKEILREARSARVLAIVSKELLDTAGGSILTQTKEKIQRFYTDASQHTVLGVTKVPPSKYQAYQEKINGIFDTFNSVMIDQTDESKLPALEEAIAGLPPIELVHKSIISADDQKCFRKTLDNRENISRVLTDLLKKFSLHSDNSPLTNISSINILLRINSLDQFSRWLDSKKHESLLVSLYSHSDREIAFSEFTLYDPYKDIMDFEDPGLNIQILEFERDLYGACFRRLVFIFEEFRLNIFPRLTHILEQRDWSDVSQLVETCSNNYHAILKTMNLKIHDCDPDDPLGSLSLNETTRGALEVLKHFAVIPAIQDLLENAEVLDQDEKDFLEKVSLSNNQYNLSQEIIADLQNIIEVDPETHKPHPLQYPDETKRKVFNQAIITLLVSVMDKLVHSFYKRLNTVTTSIERLTSNG